MKLVPGVWLPIRVLLVALCIGMYLRLANVPAYDAGAEGKVERVRCVLFDPFDKRVLVCAHRCGNPPENSLSALARAVAMNVDIVEIDVALTEDGTVVVFHDRTIDRTTGETGEISELNLEQVRRLRLKKSMVGEPPPTLERFLGMAGADLFVCVDTKETDVEKILNAVRRAGAQDRTIYYGNAEKLTLLRKLAPEAILMAPVHRESEIEQVANRFHPILIHIAPRLLTPDVSMKIRKLGARPFVNTVGHRDYVAFVNLHAGYTSLLLKMPGAIQTDEPQMVTKCLARHGLAVQ